MNPRFSLPVLCALLLIPAAPRAETPSMDGLVQRGLTAMYNWDYAGAKTAFQELTRAFPEHPMGPYALTTALWWELTNEYDEENPALEKEFLGAARRAADAARAAIKREDPDGSAHLCLGGALGLLGRWDAIQGHWLKAYREGKGAFRAQARAIEINPDLHDAYLGVGIFHYYTATLPAVVKVLAKLIFGGNKQQGLSEIRLAMEKGRFSRTAAQLFLIGIYNNTEKDYPAALALVREGRREFPDSPFFHFIELLTLENAGDWEGVKGGAEDFLGKIEGGAPNYRKSHLHRALFAQANGFLGGGDLAEALARYDRILKEFPYEDRWISMAYLNRGKTRDLLGEREEALKDYRAVLKRRDVWQLHDKAKELIEEPYTAEKP